MVLDLWKADVGLSSINITPDKKVRIAGEARGEEALLKTMKMPGHATKIEEARKLVEQALEAGKKKP